MRGTLRVLLATSLLAVPAIASVVVAPPAGAVTTPPVLTAPATAGSYSNLVPVAFTLPDAPLAGSVVLAFAGPTTCALTLTNSGTASFTLNTQAPGASANVVSNDCGGSIADGTYTVALTYRNSGGDPAATAVATGVVIATPQTLPPTLTNPSASTTYAGTVPVAYTLPEAPLPGSVTLTFAGSTTCVLSMSDSQNVSFTLTPSAVAIAGPVTASSCGSTIPNGTYSVAVSYQDAGAAPQANAVHNAVVLAPAVATTTTTATTTTAPTTTSAPTTAPPATAPTTTRAATTSNAGGSASGSDLASTGTGDTAPFTLVGLGGAIAGCGLLLVRRRNAP